jgi:DNA-binding response OmpR family regulator
MTTIVVIEDKQTLLKEILTILSYEGFNVVGASNGQAGLQLIQEQKPDLIISDIMMPGLDGYGVLEALRQDPETATIPLIFLTAKAEKSFMRQGMELGADDYLTKPFTTDELLAAVRARLARHRALGEATARDLERAKKTLTQLVAHELRTPLASITMVQNYISRQLGQLSQAELQDLLDSMRSGSQRLRHVVEQMVFMTQLEAGLLTRETVETVAHPHHCGRY